MIRYDKFILRETTNKQTELCSLLHAQLDQPSFDNSNHSIIIETSCYTKLIPHQLASYATVGAIHTQSSLVSTQATEESQTKWQQ